MSGTNTGSIRFRARFSPDSLLAGMKAPAPRQIWALSAAVAGLMSLSCGSGHATLQLSAPPTVVAGAPFAATVTAFYNGQRDTSINGPIHFTTTDKAAALPTLYVFTLADAGSHTFDLTLVTPGVQSITVSDYTAPVIAGTTNVMVSAASPAAEVTARAPSAVQDTAFHTPAPGAQNVAGRLGRDRSLRPIGDGGVGSRQLD